MSEKIDISFVGTLEHNCSLDTELSDNEIRKIKREGKFRKEYCAMLEEHMQSNSFSSFGGVIKVNNSTLYLWLNKCSEFRGVYEKYKKSKTKLYP